MSKEHVFNLLHKNCISVQQFHYFRIRSMQFRLYLHGYRIRKDISFSKTYENILDVHKISSSAPYKKIKKYSEEVYLMKKCASKKGQKSLKLFEASSNKTAKKNKYIMLDSHNILEILPQRPKNSMQTVSSNFSKKLPMEYFLKSLKKNSSLKKIKSSVIPDSSCSEHKKNEIISAALPHSFTASQNQRIKAALKDKNLLKLPEQIWCVAIAPVHLQGLDGISKAFKRGRSTVKQWYESGAPIAYDGVAYSSEYNALFAWYLNTFR